MAKLLTVNEAAARLRVSRRRVRQLIEEGRLRAERVGPVYVIKESALGRVRYRPVGRPRKSR
jgi:excisionase family DNA binding protein